MDIKIKSISYLLEEKKTFINKLLSFNNRETAEKSQEKELLNPENVLLLDKVSMHLPPGSVTSIIGLGFGHKCLIECIALRQKEGLMSGKISYDGSSRKNGIFKDIVLINDVGITHFDSLTVLDYLYYGARLRISHGTIECRERARLAAKIVNIDGNSRLGTLSKSEIRVLNIAVELVGNPTLICLLDPTEGLDASGKLEVMKVLHSIAKRNSMPTTIIYNINGINDDMIRHTDFVCVFIKNQMKYFYNNLQMTSTITNHMILSKIATIITQISLIVIDGNINLSRSSDNTSSSEDHRNAINRLINQLKEIENTHNVLEIDMTVNHESNGERKRDPLKDSQEQLDMLESVRDDASSSRVDELTAESKSKDTKSKAKAVSKQFNDVDFYSASRRHGDAGLPIRYHKALLKEVKILLERSIKYHLNNRVYLQMGLFRFMIAGVIIGCLVLSVGNNINNIDLVDDSTNLIDSNAYDVSSAMFVVVAMSLTGTAFAVPYLHSNTLQLKFEVASGLQSTLASWLSLVLIDIPLYLFAAAIVGAIVFSMIRVQGPTFLLYVTILVTTVIGYSLACVCAIWFHSRGLASFVFSIIASVCLIFSGFLQTLPNLPGLLPWATSVVYTRWAFESLLLTAFSNAVDNNELLNLYGFNSRSAQYCIGWLAIWLGGLQILVVVGLLPPIYKMRFTTDKAFKSIRVQFSRMTSVDTTVLSKEPSSTGVSQTLETGRTVRFSYDDTLMTVVNVPKAMHTTISFQRLKFMNYGLNNDTLEPVFQGVSGKVEPNSCCCIIDGSMSGAGTLLLNVLAGRIRSSGKVTGVITVNDQKIAKDLFYINSAYVQRGDVSNVASLTPREVLRFAALLRRTDQKTCASCLMVARTVFKTSVPYESIGGSELIGMTGDIEDRISDALSMLGLDDVADSVIGEVRDGENNYSNGQTRFFMQNKSFNYNYSVNNRNKPALTPAQLRCLSIGVELVNRPGMIFIDDPTSDLEWQDAEVVVKVIKSLASGGRSILCNLEKPSYRIYTSFDHTLLLGSGMLLYGGPTEKAAEYFSNIGFESRNGQNSLEFIMDIAADKGKMSITNTGHRVSNLSPADLADLNKSLSTVKISPGTKKRGSDIESKSISSYDGSHRTLSRSATSLHSSDGVAISLQDIILNEKKATSMKIPSNPALTTKRFIPSVGPLCFILLAREFRILRKNQRSVIIHWLRCLIAGISIGCVWWSTGESNFSSRISLFATSYIFINLFVFDSIEGIYKRRDVFIREASVNVTSFLSYYLTDSIPSLLLIISGTILFVFPIYFMAGLRNNGGAFITFFSLILASTYSNFSLAYLLSMLVDSLAVSKMIYSGVIVPLQLLTSGYLILISTMTTWNSWGSYICPMSYYLAGAFRNEYINNSAALGDISYSQLSNYYSFHASIGSALAALIITGAIYKACWFIALASAVYYEHKNLKSKVKTIKRKAKRIITASLRSSNSSASGGMAYNNIEDEAFADLEFNSTLHIS
eukprot:gene4858-6808_t